MNVITILLLYLLLTNLLGFFAMFSDKQRAKKRAFRIPESTFFAIAIIGGSIGCIVGMHLFHHKTKHWYFVYGIPAILVIQIICLLLLKISPVEIRLL